MGGFRGFKMFVRGGQNFSACFVCGEGGGSGSTSPSVKETTDPLLLTND